MFIAQQLREKNIAEYLIYMWQVEDLIRANDCDIDKIKSTIIAGFKISEDEKNKLSQWYEDLIVMMREEGVTGKGHLQINKNVVMALSELHSELLGSSKFPFYSSTFFKALPYIAELQAKSGKTKESEVLTCIEALYGVMLLRLQKKEISNETAKAMSEISKLISMLANFYNQDKDGELKIND